jgi:hypothetical protein
MWSSPSLDLRSNRYLQGLTSAQSGRTGREKRIGDPKEIPCNTRMRNVLVVLHVVSLRMCVGSCVFPSNVCRRVAREKDIFANIHTLGRVIHAHVAKGPRRRAVKGGIILSAGQPLAWKMPETTIDSKENSLKEAVYSPKQWWTQNSTTRDAL